MYAAMCSLTCPLRINACIICVCVCVCVCAYLCVSVCINSCPRLFKHVGGRINPLPHPSYVALRAFNPIYRKTPIPTHTHARAHPGPPPNARRRAQRRTHPPSPPHPRQTFISLNFSLNLHSVLIISSHARIHRNTLHLHPPPRRSHNQVGDTGAGALAAALARLTALQTLGLR